jgi:toxin YoeB
VTVIFDDDAWEDYLYWQRTDPKVLKRINALIKEIQRNPYEGVGKPEPLKYNFAGYWSRRINDEHRLVYQVNDNGVLIAQLRYHY